MAQYPMGILPVSKTKAISTHLTQFRPAEAISIKSISVYSDQRVLSASDCQDTHNERLVVLLHLDGKIRTHGL